MPLKMFFVILIKLFRWVEGQWKDDVSLSHSTLLLHKGVAGAACSWWWGKTQPHSARSVFAEMPPVTNHVCFSFFDNTAHIWVKNCKELLPSSYNTSRFDQPLQATEWLRNFRITNEHFLSKVWVPYMYISRGRIFTWAGLQFHGVRSTCWLEN